MICIKRFYRNSALVNFEQRVQDDPSQGFSSFFKDCGIDFCLECARMNFFMFSY